MKTVITVTVTTPDDTMNVADAIAFALDNPMNYPDDADNISEWDVSVSGGRVVQDDPEPETWAQHYDPVTGMPVNL